MVGDSIAQVFVFGAFVIFAIWLVYNLVRVLWHGWLKDVADPNRPSKATLELQEEREHPRPERSALRTEQELERVFAPEPEPTDGDFILDKVQEKRLQASLLRHQEKHEEWVRLSKEISRAYEERRVAENAEIQRLAVEIRAGRVGREYAESLRAHEDAFDARKAAMDEKIRRLEELPDRLLREDS